jgi:hypothetical protein
MQEQNISEGNITLLVMKAKKIEFIYLERSQNPAEMFTKSLLRLKNEFCKEKMGVHSITPLKHELIESSIEKAYI